MSDSRLGIVIDGEASLGSSRDGSVGFVVVRSTFLNPPRAAAARRMAERVRNAHAGATLIPYAWHYLTHEPGDGIEVGSNRSLGQTDHGHLRGKGSAQAWEVTKICAEAMEARHVVIRTPPSFSPGSLSRRRLTSFIEQLGEGQPRLIWEPEGLWTPADAAAFSAPLGIEIMARAFGMSGQLLELEGASWLRIGGGKDARLRSSQAEVLAYELEDRGLANANIAFEGPRALANLRTFARAQADLL